MLDCPEWNWSLDICQHKKQGLLGPASSKRLDICQQWNWKRLNVTIMDKLLSMLVDARRFGDSYYVSKLYVFHSICYDLQPSKLLYIKYQQKDSFQELTLVLTKFGYPL
jgi:hypothetical protein